MNSAILALEDGTVFEGRSFGAPAERSGEVVFNTALTGYQEIFTDPSYSGQIVILTNPQIGNYGTSRADNEAAQALHRRSRRARILRASPATGAPTKRPTVSSRKAGIPVISDLDTRALVRHLRSRGVMRGVLSSIEQDAREAGRKGPLAFPSMAGLDLASRVTTPRALRMDRSPSSPARPPISSAAPPSRAITWSLTISASSTTFCAAWCMSGCRVTVVPALTSAEDVLALKPDGVFLSNGPGDPEPLEHAGRQCPQAHRQDADLRHLPGPSDSRPRAAAARPTS